MVGFDVSERTVSPWMRRAPRDSEAAQRWRTFLHNHREAIAAVDFFAVPTVTFGLLYCFFIIAHDRRRILHFNVSRHPTSIWTAQQLRDAFPYADVPRFVVFDHGQIRTRSASHDSRNEHFATAKFDCMPLAERSSGAMGGKLPP